MKRLSIVFLSIAGLMYLTGLVLSAHPEGLEKSKSIMTFALAAGQIPLGLSMIALSRSILMNGVEKSKRGFAVWYQWFGFLQIVSAVGIIYFFYGDIGTDLYAAKINLIAMVAGLLYAFSLACIQAVLIGLYMQRVLRAKEVPNAM